MEISQINYTGELHCTAVHLLSGTHITTDAPRDNEGKGESFSPTDLTCVSLATCMLTTMAIRAGKSGFTFGTASARVWKMMGNNPRKIDTIRVEIAVTSGSYTNEQMSLLENAAHNCPVALSLSSEVKQEIRIVYKH